MQTSPRKELIPTRQTLLSRLKDWTDQDSWRDFFDTYWKLVYFTAKKSGLTNTEAEDVVQETVFSVAKQMPSFKYDPQNGSFKAWLLNLTFWRITDQFRKRQKATSLEAREDETGELDTSENAPQAPSALESLWNEEWEQNLMDAAIEKVKKRASAREFQMFDLYVLQKWSVARVSEFFRVNRSRVYLAKHRVSKMIKKEVKRLESEPI